MSGLSSDRVVHSRRNSRWNADQPGGGEKKAIELDNAAPAVACAPFARYVLGQPDMSAEDADPARRVLSQGLRGYLLAFNRTDPYDVLPGAEVAIRSHH